MYTRSQSYKIGVLSKTKHGTSNTLLTKQPWVVVRNERSDSTIRANYSSRVALLLAERRPFN